MMIASIIQSLFVEVMMFAMSNRTFRNAGVALGAIASIGLTSLEAKAQTLVNNSGSAACAHHDNKTDAGVRCEIREIDKRIKASRQRGLEADRRAADADARAAAAKAEHDILKLIQGCGEYLKAERGKSFTQEQMMHAAGGKITNENMCDVARKFGYVGPRASLPAAPVR